MSNYAFKRIKKILDEKKIRFEMIDGDIKFVCQGIDFRVNNSKKHYSWFCDILIEEDAGEDQAYSDILDTEEDFLECLEDYRYILSTCLLRRVLYHISLYRGMGNVVVEELFPASQNNDDKFSCFILTILPFATKEEPRSVTIVGEVDSKDCFLRFREVDERSENETPQEIYNRMIRDSEDSCTYLEYETDFEEYIEKFFS